MKNGKPRLVTTYKNGELSGKTKVYFANGSLACEATFNDGELHGERHCNYRDGSKGVTEEWQSGVLKRAEYRDQRGKVVEKGEYFDDESLKPEFLIP